MSSDRLTILSNQNILRLQISVNDLSLVQMTQSYWNLHDEELNLVFGKRSFLLLKVVEKHATFDKWHNEI